MTDAERRAKVIYSLLLLWEENPHLRFCQLVCDINQGSDGFYVEDDQFLQRLEGFRETTQAIRAANEK